MQVGNTPVELLYRRKYITTDKNVNINKSLFSCLERILVITNGVFIIQ